VPATIVNGLHAIHVNPQEFTRKNLPARIHPQEFTRKNSSRPLLQSDCARELCVCVCVSVCVRANCVCVSACLFVCERIVCACLCVCVCTRELCVRVCVSVCVHANCVCVCVSVCVHVYRVQAIYLHHVSATDTYLSATTPRVAMRAYRATTYRMPYLYSLFLQMSPRISV